MIQTRDVEGENGAVQLIGAVIGAEPAWELLNTLKTKKKQKTLWCGVVWCGEGQQWSGALS